MWSLPAIAVAAAGAATVSVMLSPGIDGVLGAALSVVMVAIAVADVRSYTIPDELTAVAYALALARAAFQGSDAMAAAVALAVTRGAVVAALFWSLRIAYRWLRVREGLGFGDVKLAAVAGAWLSWTAIPVAVEIGACAGILVYAVRQIVLRRPLRAAARLPFGAFFAPAIWLGWVFETVILGRL